MVRSDRYLLQDGTNVNPCQLLPSEIEADRRILAQAHARARALYGETAPGCRHEQSTLCVWIDHDVETGERWVFYGYQCDGCGALLLDETPEADQLPDHLPLADVQMANLAREAELMRTARPAANVAAMQFFAQAVR